jgi:hypothetical protein
MLRGFPGDDQRANCPAIRAPASRDLGAGKAGGRHFTPIIKSFFTALTPSTFSAIRVARSATFAERAVP